MPGRALGVNGFVVQVWDIAVDAIRARKPIILSTQYMDEEEAQRAVDFLAGAVMVLFGTLECVGDGLFLITPSNTEIGDILHEKRRWFF